MRFIKIIVSTLIVILGIVFIIENLEMLEHSVQIRLDLYFVTLQTPHMHLWVLVLFAFFLGVFTASLYGIYELYQNRQTIRQLRHNLDIMAREVKKATAPSEASVATSEPQVASPSE